MLYPIMQFLDQSSENFHSIFENRTPASNKIFIFLIYVVLSEILFFWKSGFPKENTHVSDLPCELRSFPFSALSKVAGAAEKGKSHILQILVNAKRSQADANKHFIRRGKAKLQIAKFFGGGPVGGVVHAWGRVEGAKRSSTENIPFGVNGQREEISPNNLGRRGADEKENLEYERAKLLNL